MPPAGVNSLRAALLEEESVTTPHDVDSEAPPFRSLASTTPMPPWRSSGEVVAAKRASSPPDADASPNQGGGSYSQIGRAIVGDEDDEVVHQTCRRDGTVVPLRTAVTIHIVRRDHAGFTTADDGLDAQREGSRGDRRAARVDVCPPCTSAAATALAPSRRGSICGRGPSLAPGGGSIGWLFSLTIAFAQLGSAEGSSIPGRVRWSGSGLNFYGCERFSYESNVWCDSGCTATLVTGCPDSSGRCQNQWGTTECGSAWFGSHYTCMCPVTSAPTSFPTTGAPTAPTSAPTAAPTLGTNETSAPTSSPTKVAAPVCKHNEMLVTTTTVNYGFEVSWTLANCTSGVSFVNNGVASQCCPVEVSPESCKTDQTTCKPFWLTCKGAW